MLDGMLDVHLIPRRLYRTTMNGHDRVARVSRDTHITGLLPITSEMSLSSLPDNAFNWSLTNGSRLACFPTTRWWLARCSMVQGDNYIYIFFTSIELYALKPYDCAIKINHMLVSDGSNF